MSDTELGLIADTTGVGSPTPSREKEEQLLVNESQFGMPQASVLGELHESLRTLMGEINSTKSEIHTIKQDKRKAALRQQAHGDMSQPSPTGPRAKKIKNRTAALNVHVPHGMGRQSQGPGRETPD